MRADDFTPAWPHLNGAHAVEREIPPWNGFGGEEDSLANCMPNGKPPRRDFVRLLEMDKDVLRFLARMVSDKPVDSTRRVILSFFLADDTVLIFEPGQAGAYTCSLSFSPYSSGTSEYTRIVCSLRIIWSLVQFSSVHWLACEHRYRRTCMRSVTHSHCVQASRLASSSSAAAWRSRVRRAIRWRPASTGRRRTSSWAPRSRSRTSASSFWMRTSTPTATWNLTRSRCATCTFARTSTFFVFVYLLSDATHTTGLCDDDEWCANAWRPTDEQRLASWRAVRSGRRPARAGEAVEGARREARGGARLLRAERPAGLRRRAVRAAALADAAAGRLCGARGDHHRALLLGPRRRAARPHGGHGHRAAPAPHEELRATRRPQDGARAARQEQVCSVLCAREALLQFTVSVRSMPAGAAACPWKTCFKFSSQCRCP